MPEGGESVWWHLLCVEGLPSGLTVRVENQRAGPRYLALVPNLLAWENWQDSGKPCLGAPRPGLWVYLMRFSKPLPGLCCPAQNLVLEQWAPGLGSGPHARSVSVSTPSTLTSPISSPFLCHPELTLQEAWKDQGGINQEERNAGPGP